MRWSWGKFWDSLTEQERIEFISNRAARRSYKWKGMSKQYNKLYIVWKHMHWRCRQENSNHRQAKYWAGRGITICYAWKTFPAFVEWALANGWQYHLDLDRRNNNEGYSPSNCRWVSEKISATNRRPRQFDINKKLSQLPLGIDKQQNKLQPFRARFFLEGKLIFVGRFKTIEEAVKARENAICTAKKSTKADILLAK
jgi:hypothetical protein